MNLLLDSQVLLWIGAGERGRLPLALRSVLEDARTRTFMSAASFWELAIKRRLGKLDLNISLLDLAAVLAAGVSHLPVSHRHATAVLEHPPVHKDPFDCLLLAQCQVEDFRLVTFDAVLAAHPLALKY